MLEGLPHPSIEWLGFSSLALDSLGRPRVAFASQDANGVGVRVSNGWAVQIVGPGTRSGTSPSIAFDANDAAYLVYYGPAADDGSNTVHVATTPGLDWVCE